MVFREDKRRGEMPSEGKVDLRVGFEGVEGAGRRSFIRERVGSGLVSTGLGGVGETSLSV